LHVAGAVFRFTSSYKSPRHLSGGEVSSAGAMNGLGVACAEIRQCCSGLERGRRLAKAQKKDLRAVRLWFILVAMEAAFLACAAAIVARAVENVFGVASPCSIALKQKRGAGRLPAAMM
jgi:hypothetical protein